MARQITFDNVDSAEASVLCAKLVSELAGYVRNPEDPETTDVPRIESLERISHVDLAQDLGTILAITVGGPAASFVAKKIVAFLARYKVTISIRGPGGELFLRSGGASELKEIQGAIEQNVDKKDS